MKMLLALLSSSLLLISCSKTPPAAAPWQEPAYTKNVVFSLAAVDDYTTPIHANSTAEVYLGLHKMSGGSPTGQLVWDTTFTRRHLTLYPMASQPLVIEKMITNIQDSKQQVLISYVKRYDLDGHKQQVASGQYCLAGNSTYRVQVGL